MFDLNDLSNRLLELVSRSVDEMEPSKMTPKDLTVLSDLAIKFASFSDSDTALGFDNQFHIYIKSDDDEFVVSDYVELRLSDKNIKKPMKTYAKYKGFT